MNTNEHTETETETRRTNKKAILALIERFDDLEALEASGHPAYDNLATLIENANKLRADSLVRDALTPD